MGHNKIDKPNTLPRAEYIVRPGDNLTIISKATGIPISILAKDNQLKDPNLLYAGQKLIFQYHPEPEESFNSPEMNAMYPNPADQKAYFEKEDAYTQMRYNQIVEDGAQKHINSKW